MSQGITLPSRCPWQFVMTVKSRSDDRNLVTFIRQTREKHNNLPVQWNLRTLRLKSENTMEKLLSLLVILTLECLPLSSNQEEIKTNIVKLPPIRWTQLNFKSSIQCKINIKTTTNNIFFRVVEGGTGVLTWRQGHTSPDLIDVNHTVIYKHSFLQSGVT